MNSRAVLAMLMLGLVGCSEATPTTGTTAVSTAPIVPVSERPAPSPSLSESPDNYAAFNAVLQRHQAMTARVARIGRTLRVKNERLCNVTRPDIGMTTHRLDDYPPDIHALALHFMALEEDGRFVKSVIPDGPADQAGVRIGDQVLSGMPFRDGGWLVVMSDGRPIRLEPDPDVACAIPTYVVESDRMNASTDGREIDLSTALIRDVGDDNLLALIIAHEMAHVIRGHTHEDAGWKAELQADDDALRMTYNAGYDPNVTVANWAAGMETVRASQDLSITHPPVSIRLEAMRRTLAELNAIKDDSFADLAP